MLRLPWVAEAGHQPLACLPAVKVHGPIGNHNVQTDLNTKVGHMDYRDKGNFIGALEDMRCRTASNKV